MLEPAQLRGRRRGRVRAGWPPEGPDASRRGSTSRTVAAASVDGPHNLACHIADLPGQFRREGQVGWLGNVDYGGDQARVVAPPPRPTPVQNLAHRGIL